MKQLSRYLIAPLCLLASSLPTLAHLHVSSTFTDQMVLQRDRPVPIWGTADEGDTITIAFAGQNKNATADASGKWLITLDPLAATFTEQTLSISSAMDDHKIALSGVLVGDVWLCSGQSNMFFRMSGVENSATEIAAADHPHLRFFQVGEQFSQSPATKVKGSWKITTPSTAGECSAVAYYFARDLVKTQKVPIGLLISSVGGTRIETWMPTSTLTSIGQATKQIEDWKRTSKEEFKSIAAAYRSYQFQRSKPKADGTAWERPKKRCHDCPGALHNGMIAPLQPFALRGVIWYQGEANSGQGAAYTKLLPAMIADWRNVWGKDMPFLFVQLASFQSTHPSFREAQMQIWQSTPNTALVVTTDVGNPKDIHPTRKKPVGERLATAARALSYGEKIEASGPLFQNMKIEGDRAILSFQHIGSGLMPTDQPLTEFTIAGKNGKYFPATASIQGDQIAVHSPQVSEPENVRYAWTFAPQTNFTNREGLPAVPFRTDGSVVK
jgi:sialate O-acetylesterase